MLSLFADQEREAKLDWSAVRGQAQTMTTARSCCLVLRRHSAIALARYGLPDIAYPMPVSELQAAMAGVRSAPGGAAAGSEAA